MFPATRRHRQISQTNFSFVMLEIFPMKIELQVDVFCRDCMLEAMCMALFAE